MVACGVRHELPALLQRLGYQHALLVTDAFFDQQTPWVRESVAALQAVGIEVTVYAGGQPDPNTTLCDEATAALRAQWLGRQPDHVIALGGGSNIDLAKALCLTLPHGRPVRSFLGDLLGQTPLPLIALPTTAGAGSEATPGAILVDPHNATKVALMDNRLRPIIAVIDPELSYTCPPRVTADAGIDAFTHAIESYLTIDSAEFPRNDHPDPGYSGRSGLTMMFARESMRLCVQWLELAYREGHNVNARVGMAYASLYAGLSYGSAGLNAVHGLAYAVAGLTHDTHGRTNAVMLPYVLDALRDVRRAELLEVAALFGIDCTDPQRAVAAVPVAVRDLIGRLGIPTDLRSFGVAPSQLANLLADALGVARLAQAVPVDDVDDLYSSIVSAAFNGQLSGVV